MRLSLTCFLLAIIVSGCSSTPEPPTPEATALEKAPAPPRSIWVARQSRYTLVELSPELAQQDLLLQVIDISLPNSLSPTVGDALHYAMRHSGYQLCDGGPDAQALFALPLPAAHIQLGPMVLHKALLTLVGPGWKMRVDDVTRQLCFNRLSELSQEASHESS